MGRHQKAIADNVISKLKDDGDFDRLRLKIVSQLKQNEDLRNNIIAAVKQSTVLNRPGAENMKPRQLCDAIHEEICEEAMNQISDGLWEIIRSGHGMEAEIKETVHSVYDKLLNPQQKSEGEPTSALGRVPVRQGTELNAPAMVSGESNDTMSNEERKEAPGFSLHNHTAITNDFKSGSQKSSPSKTPEKARSPSPGLSSSGKRKRASDANDEDPDIPPGFG